MIGMYTFIWLLCASVNSIHFGSALDSIDPDTAAGYFAEARRLGEADGGRLWGTRLDGPMLFVDPATRDVVANAADAKGAFEKRGSVYVGRLPPNVPMANTAVEWSGVKWTMILWPLPSDSTDRACLMMHECFHRIQDTLGLAGKDPPNPHLDRADGRIWLQLEWRALGKALASQGDERRSAVADALLFRGQRRAMFAGADATERALEMHEGLAEYTGQVLCGVGGEKIGLRVRESLTAAAAKPSFVRSFAYASGPAYGVLLDVARPDWRTALKPSIDLGDLLADALSIQRETPDLQRAAERAKRYDGEALRTAEEERSRRRAEELARYRERLVGGPVLAIALKKPNVEFNPNTLVPLGEAGTIYPTMTVHDEWGTLRVERGGGLLANDWSRVTVSARDIDAKAARGDGWTLVAAESWLIQPGGRAGDFVLKRAAGKP